ncbi:polyamine-modulated factor 1-binding protein 1 isoform X2 [Brienomyrus brachyistius]|uniref:polyamine-modulated factor 1-binding protein 1 isoform X2 n=1 Tax=Brienomyrus brachyistius TaxID=42636 RepID=UPI0020B22179|nr:polyamine-modulated factor 1-binding protein 1 isoform X2 [Brienomyrus brachyistius]
MKRPAELYSLLMEFRVLYLERLQRIDESESNVEQKLQSKVEALQSFVQDLSQQNEALIQTVLEVEQETENQSRNSQKALQMDEREIQTLQDTITELHHELSLKDQENLRQMQELHRFESKVKEVNADGTHLSPTPTQPFSVRDKRFLSELVQRDGIIQKLRNDVLLQLQARDSQSAQLDIQEQRITQLQTELQESQLEQQRRQSRIQQLQRDLLASERQTEDLRAQLSEVKGHLVTVEGENDALKCYKLDLSVEVERLTGEVCTLQATAQGKHSTEARLTKQKYLDLQRELEEVQGRLSECQGRAQDATRELQERNAELQRLQTACDELQGHERQWEKERTALRHKLSRSKEELRSATLRLEQQEDNMRALAAVAESLREKLRHQDDDASSLRQQLLCSQDALQQATTELRAYKREEEEQLVQEEDATARLKGQLREAVRQQRHLASRVLQLTAEARDLYTEVGLLTESHRAALQEVADRDEAVAMLTAELRAAQERLRSVQEEYEVQQGALCTANEELQRWQAEARAQVDKAQSRLQQYLSSAEMLGAHGDQAQRQAEEEQALQKHPQPCSVETDQLRGAPQEAQPPPPPLTQALDSNEQKYRVSLGTVSRLEERVQAQDRELQEARMQHNVQVQRRHWKASPLCCDLQGRSAQLQAQDESLGDLRQQLEESLQHGLECELIIRTLRKQVEEQEEAVLKIQADFFLYKATHLLSDPDCEPHLWRIQEPQQELSCAVEQLAQDAQELGLYQADACQLKEKASHLTKHRNPDIKEAVRLQEAVGQLQGKTAAEPQRRWGEKQTFCLQGELQATQQQENMEGLLKEVEAPLVESSEVIREQSLETERQGLEADLQRAMKENQQGKTESATLRAELLRLQEELKLERSCCKNLAETPARQKKEALLAERGQQGALGDKEAWPQQEERRCQAELRVLQDELCKMEHHGQGGRSQVGTLTVQVSKGRMAQLDTGAEHPERELTCKRGGIGTQQQQSLQLKEQEEHILSMSELGSATLRLQCVAELEAKRTENRQLGQEPQAWTYEGRLTEVCTQLARSRCWGQEQLAALEAKEAEAVALRVEVTSLRENYRAKVTEVDTSHSQLDLMRQKYQAAANEVDVLRRFLGNARANSIRLHQESELVVSSVHQWVKEQKQANEKLRTKIKEQSRKIRHLTTEKDFLQEHREQLLEEMRMLKTQLDGQRMDVEGLVAHDQPGARRGGSDEQALQESTWKRPASLSQHPRQPLTQKSLEHRAGCSLMRRIPACNANELFAFSPVQG